MIALHPGPTHGTLGCVLVRPERPDDAARVLAVHDAAFADPDAPGPTTEAALVDRLRADGDLVSGLCLVAEDDGVVVGHVACSRGHVGDVRAVALGPIGVLPVAQRVGVGSALMREVLDVAQGAGEPAVFLLGEPAYYVRFGFEPARAHGVDAPDAAWGDYFQVRVLPSWDPAVAGVFRYPPAFGVG